jgi:uncharacterized membrane protein (DUF485 family)
MLHEPAVELGVNYASRQKTRLGFILFLVYAILYGTFVIIGLNYTHLMGLKVFAGLNLAVTFGIGLIVLAAVMGYIYSLICSGMEDKMEKEAKQ